MVVRGISGSQKYKNLFWLLIYIECAGRLIYYMNKEKILEIFFIMRLRRYEKN